jgi:O-antigen/teichoic acid export membrane protein
MQNTVQERETVFQEIQTAVRHMAVYGVGNVLVKALGFLMLPFYTHYLGTKDYGILEILDLSMTLFGLVLNMGLVPAFLRCYAAVNSAADKYRFVSTGCIAGFLTGLFTLLMGIGFVRPLTHLLFGSAIPATYVLLAFAALVLNYMATLPRTYLRALEASGAYVTCDTIGVFVLLFLNVFFIAVLKMGLVGVLWSSFIVAAAQFVGYSVWTMHRTGFAFDGSSISRMLRFGLPLILSNIGLFVLNFSDRFFLQHLRSLDAVGVYAVGYKFGFMMNYLVVQPFFVMWQSRMYAIHSQPQHPTIFRQIFSLYSFGLIYAGLAMSLFGSEAVRLMVAPKFAASQEVIPIVVLSYVFYGLSYYAQLGMLLTDRTGAVGCIGAATAGLNLVLNYFLISSYGMLGAAWATALSFLFLTAVSYIWSQRVLPLKLGVPRTWAGMIAATIVYLCCQRVAPGNVLMAVLVKCLALAAFPVILWKTGILPPSACGILIAGKHQATGALGRVWRTASRKYMTEVS